MSEEDLAFLSEFEVTRELETDYARLQGTKPQSLGYGLNDSRGGLLAWIIGKFRAWNLPLKDEPMDSRAG